MLYLELMDYSEAETLLRLAHDIQRKSKAKSTRFRFQPEWSGMLYEKKADYDQAEALYRRSIEIQKKVVGQESRGYAIVLHNLARLRAKMGTMFRLSPSFDRLLGFSKRRILYMQCV